MQASLFDTRTLSLGPLVPTQHIDLSDGAWVDYLPAWLDGHSELYKSLVDSVNWRARKRPMYDRVVDIPRLLGSWPEYRALTPILSEASSALSGYYSRPLRSIGFSWYRDGNDSVAWHGDKLGERRSDSVVAILSVGEPRRFLLRANDGSHTLRFHLGWGDLLVMGGRCQETWQHCVPKVKATGPRISIVFRERHPTSSRIRTSSAQ